MKMIEPIAIDPGTPTFDLISLSVDFVAEAYSVDGSLSAEATKLVYSDVPEDDADLWTAGSYDAEDRVIYDHRFYEALATTTDQPDVGAAKEVPTWLDLGATNRWKMVDGIIAAATTQSGAITISVEPGALVNAIAFFGLMGSQMTITLTDPVEGVVYTRIVELQDDSRIIDAYAYCFDPIIFISELVIDDLPAYPDAIIDISIFAGEGTAQIGEMVMGALTQIGEALYGTGGSLQSYSLVSEDPFGGLTITRRGYVEPLEFPVWVETSQVARVKRLIAARRDLPTVWIGETTKEATITYGIVKNFRWVMNDGQGSAYNLETRSLI